MADARAQARVAFLSSSWGRTYAEAAFVGRVVAGGLSRLAHVDVFVPGAPGPARADGAFDVAAIGEPADGQRWPLPRDAVLPAEPRYDLAVIDRPTAVARAILEHGLTELPPIVGLVGGRRPAVPTTSTSTLDVGMARAVALRPAAQEEAHAVGCHVAVNPLARARRHSGLGSTGYLLVLTDRRGPVGEAQPPPFARWLIARFTRDVVVVIEDAVASVWRSRSLLGRITVDTRTDLWRLVAHAAVTVDLDPGPYLARECVESLRFGVPIVVPAGTSGHRLAAAGGGLWFSDVAELFGCVESLQQPDVHDALGRQGKAAVDRWYGDPAAFVDRLGAALPSLRRTGDRPAAG